MQEASVLQVEDFVEWNKPPNSIQKETENPTLIVRFKRGGHYVSTDDIKSIDGKWSAHIGAGVEKHHNQRE